MRPNRRNLQAAIWALLSPVFAAHASPVDFCDVTVPGIVVVTCSPYKAVGDGVADDTPAFARAVADAPQGTTIFVPEGVYLIRSTLHIPKHVHLKGVGWTFRLQRHFGHHDYNEPDRFGGTVLLFEGSGPAIHFDYSLLPYNRDGSRVQDILVVGAGLPNTTGIQITASVRFQLWRVLVANFSTGVQLDGVQDASFYSLSIQGTEAGLRFDSPSSAANNQNVFYNLENENSRAAIVFQHANSSLNIFYGGLVQNINGDAIALDNCLCGGNVFDGIWFENVVGDSLRVSGNNVARTRFFNNHVASNAGGMSLHGGTSNGGHVLGFNKAFGNKPLHVARSTSSTLLLHNSGFRIDNQSSSTTQLSPGGGLAIASLSGSGVTGRNLRGEVRFSGARVARVRFPTRQPEPDNDYFVTVTGNANETFWVTDRTDTGFDVHSSNSSSTATVAWHLVR